MLREVIVKIGLKRINTQKEITVETLLDSSVIGLVISLEFARKQGFKLKKINKLIYIRNVNSSFNKEEPIEHMVEVNIYYQGYRERTEMNMIEEQKWSVILGILWLAHHNSETNWKIEDDKMSRGVWKTVEAKIEKTRVVKTKGKKEERGREK